ncbi:MAG: hydrogenase nickel insertion protein HypA [Thermoprotei archaeon]|nr:MAG: hydrogenase nickel insertion protein HypA [Thermoprotei archaeon]
MHEWALAEAIVWSIVDYVKANGGKAAGKVVVSLGELQAINKEVLRYALSELVKEAPFKISGVELVDEKAVFRCRNCGHEWGLDDLKLGDEIREFIHFLPEVVHAYVKCPSCGSSDYEVVSGRGVKIISIEVVK